MTKKTILDGIILKIDNGYPLLQAEYKTLLEVGNWYSGTIDYRNVKKEYYVVGNLEKGYFRFYRAKSEWVVDGYFDIKRVQRKSEQVTETRVWYE